MMDDKIAKIEQEQALLRQVQVQMGDTLSDISTLLKELMKVDTHTKLVDSKLSSLDRELKDSFQRVHKRIDSIDATRTWITRLVFGIIIVTVMGIAMKQKITGGN
jgi:hypothetical protein